MTQAKVKFASFEAYLASDPKDLPEGRYEYWDGELVELMPESGENDDIANFLFVVLLTMGIPLQLLKPHSCEVEVPGKPRTRFPDLVILREEHPALLKQRNTITRKMPPPQVIVEVISPGKQNRERDLIEKRQQYCELGVPEYWLIDPEYQTITVLWLQDGQYTEHGVFGRNQQMSSPTFGLLPMTTQQILTAH